MFASVNGTIVDVLLGDIQCVWLFVRCHVRWLPRRSSPGCELWPSSFGQIGEPSVFNEQTKREDSELTCSVCNWFVIILSDWCKCLFLNELLRLVWLADLLLNEFISSCLIIPPGSVKMFCLFVLTMWNRLSIRLTFHSCQLALSANLPC